jgi:amino acid transporter
MGPGSVLFLVQGVIKNGSFMQSQRTIGFGRAVLLSTNVMIGAGVFLNISHLTKLVGSWGFTGYLLGSAVLLPVVISLAALVSVNAVAGGLLEYAKEHIHPLVGFLSSWSYFVGKAVSVALLASAFVTPFYLNILPMHILPKLFWVYGLILMLALINIVGVSIGGKIQWLFTAIKFIPFSAVICSAFLKGHWLSESFVGGWLGSSNLFYTIPVALFALSGFEVIANIGHMIKDPEKNAMPVAIASSLIVAGIYSLFQLSAYILSGSELGIAAKPLEFLAGNLFYPFSNIGFMIDDFMLASMLSGAFSLLTNNAWNMFALAKNRAFVGSRFATKISFGGAPWVALLIEVFISCLVLGITVNQLALLNMSVFATALSYLITTIAALVAFYKVPRIPWIIPLVGVFSCSYVLMVCSEKIIASGVSMAFVFVFSLGLFSAALKRFI